MVRVWRPLTAHTTYTGWVWFILGGAAVMPFLMVGMVVRVAVIGGYDTGGPAYSFVDVTMFGLMLPVVFLTGLVLPVRAISVVVARTLLRVDLPEVGRRRDRSHRVREACWLTIHLGMGGVLAGTTLALVPFAAVITALPVWRDRALPESLRALTPWSWLGPIVGPAMIVGLILTVAGATTVVRRLAVRLLGPTAAEQLAASRARARDLAARNRIARELHDSVGHALSVVTVQAAAAHKVIDTDPAFVARALAAVADTARDALADLDTVLGVLRDDGPVGTGPARTLADLSDLVDTCGIRVTGQVDGDPAALPAVVSREAYRIVQEALTNAVKYGDGTAAIRVGHTDDELTVEVVNPCGPAARAVRRDRGGRGLAGMSERVTVLGGVVTAGEHDGRWRVVATIPLAVRP